MDLTKILAISGKPGLHKLVAQSKNNLIVESLSDQKRFPVYATQPVSALEEIAVFTTGEDVKLKEVFKRMFDVTQGTAGPDSKEDAAVLMAFFEQALPEYDRNRVYLSDIRKMISWYNILIQHQLLDFSQESEPQEETPENEQK